MTQNELTVLLGEHAKSREKSASSQPAPFWSIFRRRVTDAEKSDFCTQLSVMLQARVSIVRALEVLIKQSEKRPINRTLELVAAQVRKGSSLDQALAMHPDVFDRLFVVTAEVGQESGRLPEVLSHLAVHLEKMNGLKRKFIQALAYPGLVMTVAAVAVTFLLVFIVPTFAEMFKSFQVELPLSTRIILQVSGLVSKYGLWVLVSAVAAAYFFVDTLKRPAVRSKLEDIAFNMPFFGTIIVKTHVARFCRTLGTLLQAQVSLVDALGVTQRIVTNDTIRKEIGSILKHVRRGHAIVDPLVDSKVFLPMVTQMIAVGEETSELDSMLLKVADYYEQEIDGTVETLSSVMEPAIVLVLGLVVAAILISMYLPMFDLVNVVGGG